MKTSAKSDRTLDYLFAIVIGSDFLFLHTIISQIALVIFAAYVIFRYHKPCMTAYFLLSYAAFAVWSSFIIIEGAALDISIAGKMTLTLWINVVFLYALAIYCDHLKGLDEILNVFNKTAIVCCIIILILGLSVSLAGNRLDDVMGQNSNVIGRLAAYAATVQIYFIKSKTNKNFLILLLYFTVILLSGSRSAFLIPLLAFFVLLVSSNPKKIVWYSFLSIIVAYLAFQLVLNIDVLYNLIGNRLEALLDIFKTGDSDEGSYMTRTAFLALGWEESWNSPIFGHGIDCFRTLKGAYDTYSHCNYIELLFGTGWVGLLIYYSTIIFVIFKAPSAIKINKAAVVAFALIIPYTILDYQNVTYFERGSIFIPAVCIWSIINQTRFL